MKFLASMTAFYKDCRPLLSPCLAIRYYPVRRQLFGVLAQTEKCAAVGDISMKKLGRVSQAAKSRRNSILLAGAWDFPKGYAGFSFVALRAQDTWTGEQRLRPRIQRPRH
ncbi:MAG: hypothetical protein ACT4O2_04785 [Beijerinckiaceae bacterium]